MGNVLAVLKERGFIDQQTHESELEAYLLGPEVTCYIGFDPTADSLHVGSLVPIMSLAHMQREGCRPIALVGGGTGLVGDPSGKTEMRKMLTEEMVEKNALGIKRQLSRYLDFSEGKALLLNNAEWLTRLMYIPFLRDIGRHFSVNRMIKAESCRLRLEAEEGLSFIEFNYMVLQAYDFLVLFDQYGCRLQMGGSDQWGNIVAGVELIRRMRQGSAFGITFPLITTSSGAKMGKTAKGAVWLTPEKTTPYEYYQYWINTEDDDVPRFLALFTFLPMEEIDAVKGIQGVELNGAKAILAFEATLLAHGREAAVDAYQASIKMFGVPRIPEMLLPSSTIPRSQEDPASGSIPSLLVERVRLAEGIPAFKLFAMAGLASSSGAARRLIEQGGAYLNGLRVDDINREVSLKDLVEDEILLRSGKKKFLKIKLK
ncbi:MAG: tyrosine--tRNA ligase [Thermodesulfobacteriota bacterium]